MNKKTDTKNRQDNKFYLFLSVVLCSTILGIFALIGTGFGELGISTMFKILGFIGFIFIGISFMGFLD